MVTFGIFISLVIISIYYALIFFFYIYLILYNNQMNARAPIGQSAMGYCAGKPMEKLRVF